MTDATPSFETLTRIIEILAEPRKSKLVVMHHNADPDALGSALALQAVFPNIQIAAPLGLSRTAKRLLDALDGTVLTKPPYERFDHIVVVDTSSKIQLGEAAKRIKDPIVLDHHPYHDTWEDASHLYVDPNMAACCELVYELIETAGREGYTTTQLNGAASDIATLEHIGLALMTGIWTDSGGFRHATPRTLQTAADLLSRTGTSIADVLTILEEEQEPQDGRQQAHLKAASRLATHRVGPLLVATSHVSAHEASAARALTLLGADVAFCIAEKNDELRASARARKAAITRTGLHLGHLMNAAGKRLNMMGGGHQGAAGMNQDLKRARAEGTPIPDRQKIIQVLLEELKSTLG
jgi:bifunctional oligoribonuclease and PAP phosphatase NrnA